MHLSSNTKTFTAILCFSLFTACSDNKDAKTATTEKNAAPEKNTEAQTASTTTATAEDGPAVATIETDIYIAKIHRVIPVVPKDEGLGMFKVKDGNQFIVLDMSVRNKSKDPIEMGQIMLGAKITDESGKDVGNLMAIAAHTYTTPNPHHQPQYDALWGTMKPGDFYRTTVLGMEAPKTSKSFKLSMKTKADFFNDKDRKEVSFTL